MSRTKERGAPEGAPLTPPHQPSADSTRQVTEPGALLLLAALRGVRDRPGSEYWAKVAFCPCHDDEETRPSLNIDYKPSKYQGEGFKLVVFCRTCRHEITLEDVCAVVGLKVADVLANNESLGRYVRPTKVAPLPRPCDVARWQEQLHADPELLAYLYEQRGLDEATVRRYEIGYDRGRYTLPVSRRGRLLNVRRYKRDAPEGQKMFNWPGLGSPPRLYPSVPSRLSVLLCEGEWDALIARRHGLLGVTTTGGVQCHWRDEWSGRFRGLHVRIVYDCQDVSRDASQGTAEALFGVAASVKVVDLRLGDKEDLTDFLLRYTRKDLLELIGTTPRWTP